MTVSASQCATDKDFSKNHKEQLCYNATSFCYCCPGHMCCFTKCPSTYHAGVHSGLFNVAGNTSDKGISVLKVGVKVCLVTDRRSVKL